MNTISNKVSAGRRRRRDHSVEFKAQVVAACRQPDMSIAAVALASDVGAGLVRRWIIDADRRTDGGSRLPSGASGVAALPAFVPLGLPPADPPAAAIRIELRRGTTAINVSWPCEAAAQCASWMRELLR